MRSILTALQEGRLFELPEAGKDRALEFLARVLDANPDIVVGTDAVEEIKQRERACNTGIGLGVAVPHIRVKREDGDLFCAIGWSQPGIEYGASDGEHVHLVFMYYIPGAQKNVYLKEISSLVKAMKISGGMEPIAHADSLFVVRNLLLDWVSEALGESGPEAVARMIKLEAKQAQAPAVAPAGETPALLSLRPSAKAQVFEVVVDPRQGALVLSADAEWVATIEKDSSLAQRLATETPFSCQGRQVYVTHVRPYAGGRISYQCVAIAG